MDSVKVLQVLIIPFLYLQNYEYHQLGFLRST